LPSKQASQLLLQTGQLLELFVDCLMLGSDRRFTLTEELLAFGESPGLKGDHRLPLLDIIRQLDRVRQIEILRSHVSNTSLPSKTFQGFLKILPFLKKKSDHRRAR
jgi:hypothetical protein